MLINTSECLLAYKCMFLLPVCFVACGCAPWIVLCLRLAFVCSLRILSKPFLTLCVLLMFFRVSVQSKKIMMNGFEDLEIRIKAQPK